MPSRTDIARSRVDPSRTLTFTFDDCSHGSVRWHSVLPGYDLANDNGFALTRLTQIAGTVCPP